jgi:glucose-1-phosphate cytidylyltransferase
MKVIILAGGLGSRLSELTKSVPKPMVKIGRTPIVVHIMKHYIKYGFNEFILATGYKSFVFKKYFKNFKKNGIFFDSKIIKKNCKICILDTGRNTLTGGRLKRVGFLIKKNENFMFTYGDGISSVNLKKLKNFHLKSKKIITVTAVRPPARFGEILIKGKIVSSFKEKPQVNNGWINGGFFIASKNFLKFIKGDMDILEKSPLEKVTKIKQLAAYKHIGFWKCMDVKRDRDELLKIYKKNNFNFTKLFREKN